MRLNKYLAKCGIGSRRACDKYIENGYIKIDGNVTYDFSYDVKESHYVQYKNKILSYCEDDYIYIINKPKGYICTLSDPKGRKKLIDLIQTPIRLFNVGRLDYNSTGLILFTNNGDIANKLLHPKNKIIKKYYVESSNKLSVKDINLIKNGIDISNFGKLSAKVSLLERNDKNSFIWDVVLTEGKNRHIKRIFNYFDNPVKKLHRYEFAGIRLKNIKSGKYKKISMKQFKKNVALKFN
jgi:pseudouridine synthase